jgi:molybdopterin converting factor small subunit
MRITVQFVGSFRNTSGANEIHLTFERNVLLMEAIQKIIARFPSLGQALKGSNSNRLILINGKEISVLSGWATSLKDGDRVILIPVVHGG